MLFFDKIATRSYSEEMSRRTEPPLEQGLQIGPYQVDQFVAKTRSSHIARATHAETGESVALKVPTETGVHLLENEYAIYRSLAGVTSSYLARMHGAGVWKSTPFLAVEWQSNGTLQERLPIPPQAAEYNSVSAPLSTPQDFRCHLQILADSAAGIEALHEVGVIHCDIKPANIAVDNNTGKLFDFGIASSGNTAPHMDSGTVFGTPGESIPPEAYMYGAITSTTRDIWAMAATAFRVLSGVKPFGKPSWDPLEGHRQVNKAPDLTLRDFHPNAPSDLDRVITEALDPDPKNRPSLSEMRGVFDRVVGQEIASSISNMTDDNAI